ncbi:MAG: hypothetical protein E7578_08145 [Ruminococcaceae bacterium]|nr:hypothetical protein [Oscillospiraceae bacterium]
MLRRIFCGILAVVTLLISQTSCEKNDTASPTDYQSSVKSATVSFDYGVTSYSADISFDGDIPTDKEKRRSATVSFTSPDEVTGLVLKYTESSTSASIGKISLDLPKNTGNEIYYAVRLFSMYPDELYESNAELAKFRANVFGAEITFEIFFDEGVPSSANIRWDNGQIKVSKITLT